jgi:Pregnancy-associated plasma protein-A
MRTLCFIVASVMGTKVAQSCDHDHHHHHHHNDQHIDHLLLDLGLEVYNVESMMDKGELEDESDESPMLRNGLRDLRRHKKKKNQRKKAPPCKNNDPSPEAEALMDAVVAARSQARNGGAGARQGIIAENATANVYSPIKVYWNVMKAGETAKLGAFNRSQADLVMAGLNQIYNNTPFQFTLAGMTQTTNANWFNCTDAVGTYLDVNFMFWASPLPRVISVVSLLTQRPNVAETAYKVKLRKEGADVLNVYQCDFLGAQGYAGEGYFPVGVQYPTYSYLDGVSIFNPFVRSGYSLNSLVTTLVHEVGHWLGVKHTFSKNNSCDGDGDSIAGTLCEATISLSLPP